MMITIGRLRELLSSFPRNYNVSAFEDDDSNYLGIYDSDSKPVAVVTTVGGGNLDFVVEGDDPELPTDEQIESYERQKRRDRGEL